MTGYRSLGPNVSDKHLIHLYMYYTRTHTHTYIYIYIDMFIQSPFVLILSGDVSRFAHHAEGFAEHRPGRLGEPLASGSERSLRSTPKTPEAPSPCQGSDSAVAVHYLTWHRSLRDLTKHTGVGLLLQAFARRPHSSWVVVWSWRRML